MSPTLLILGTFALAALPRALAAAGLGFRRFDPQDLTILACAPAVPFIMWALA
jgi:hypothetical protein